MREGVSGARGGWLEEGEGGRTGVMRWWVDVAVGLSNISHAPARKVVDEGAGTRVLSLGTILPSPLPRKVTA